MSVGKTELINQICVNSGLKGKHLQELKTRLSKMSEEQLKTELSKSLSGKESMDIGFDNFVELNPKTTFNGNVFGTGFAKQDDDLGLNLGFKNNKPTSYTPVQQMAMSFLKELTQSTLDTVKEHENESGFLTGVVNTWNKVFDKENTSSFINDTIKDTEKDVYMLESTAKGEVHKGFTEELQTFEETFRQQRGVDFNEENIVKCSEKSKEMAEVQSQKLVIDKLKGLLSSSTINDASNAGFKDANDAIMQTFLYLGVKKQADINNILKGISEKHKNDPDVQKYGGDFSLAKNKAGKYMIYRTDKSGNRSEAPMEELQIIAKEMKYMANLAYGTVIGAEIPADATYEQLEQITTDKYNEHKSEYEDAFKTAYGKKDIKELAEKFVQSQQEGVANIEMGLNMASMALMVVPGGALGTSNWVLRGSIAAKNSALLGKAARGLQLVDKAKKFNAAVKGWSLVDRTSKASQLLNLGLMGNLTLKPTQLLEKMTSENGMSTEDWEEWGKGVLESSIYMGLGMGASKLAEEGAAMFKTKALVNSLKTTKINGKMLTTDDISAMVRANPVKFPKEIVQSFSKIDNMAKALQVSGEVVLDISSTYLANKALGNGDLTNQDWFMSVGFALSGGILQKQFASLSNEAKVKYIQNAFQDIHISSDEALNILKTMDDISAGKIRARKTSAHPKAASQGSNELPEVVVKPDVPAAKPKSASPEAPETQTAVNTSEFAPFKPNKTKTALQIQNEQFAAADEILIKKLKELGDGEKLAEKIKGYGGDEHQHKALGDILFLYEKQITFTPEERQLILETTYGGKKGIEEQKGFIGKNDTEIAMIYSMNDVGSRNNINQQYDILNTLRTIKSNSENYGVTDAQFDIEKVIKSFNNREFKMYDAEYLYYIREMLSRASELMINGKTEEALKRVNFDYSKMHERNIFQLIEPSKSVDQMQELLFCSDEEFLKKYERIQKNRDLFFPTDYKKFLQIETWSKLLNASDEEFNKLVTPVDKRPVVMTDINAYRAEIQDKLSKPLAYKPEDVKRLDLKPLIAQSRKRYVYKPDKLLAFEGLPQKPVKPIETLDVPNSRFLMEQLRADKMPSINIDIPDRGGVNPTRSEIPVIHPEDFEKLGVAEDAEIELKYGVKRNWSNTKIARDIMQNFYDGNGHTLEGVKIDITKEGAEYVVKVSGEGNYDYEHLEYLGDSDKEFDPHSAGNFGEGTRIVAVNLLANRNAPYVKYACGDWAMTFNKSSDDVRTAYMTQTLTKNDNNVKGSYIEFKTTDPKLVQEILNSKDYFYSPFNKDFQNLDYENEFFGFKQLPKGQKGNVYIVQRYETVDGINEPIDGMTIIFKKMPNAPELVEKSGDKFKLNDRDRSYLCTYDIQKLIKRYAKTMTDEELTQTIVSLKPLWEIKNGDATETGNTFIIEALTQEAVSRSVGIDFSKEKYFAVDDNTSPDDIEMAKLMGYTPARRFMSNTGMGDYNSTGLETKTSITPETHEVQRIKLLDEGMRIIQENLGYEDLKLIPAEEVDTPKFIYEDGGSESAEALTSRMGTSYKGHWVKRSKLFLDDYIGNLATWLHECQHKFGGDTDTSFSYALVDIQKNILQILAHNPDALAKMRELAKMYSETLNKTGSTVENTPAETFKPAKYKQELSQILDAPSEYVEFIEQSKDELQPASSGGNNTITKSISGTSSFGLDKVGGKTPKTFKSKSGLMNRLKSTVLKLVRKNSAENHDEPVIENPKLNTILENAPRSDSSKPVVPYKKLPERTSIQTSERLMSTDEAIKAMDVYNSVKVEVPNQGGLKPTRDEAPVIHPEDVEILGKKQRVRMKLKYGQKTNWSDAKLARDIMQNFFDGNGHTMEGVSIDVVKENGAYKIRVSGEGHFDYVHLKRIGASNKADDEFNAGSYGEGTRVVAVNLLANKNVPGVKYACGDWTMTFESSSQDFQKAHMTRTLEQNSVPVKGTYLEFTTPNENLVKEIFNAKDYFYHPYNKDFQNLEFENEFFGFKHNEKNKAGNIYLVQRYETAERGMEGSVDDLTIVFKQMPNAPKLIDIIGYPYQLDTGCDRVALSDETIKDLGRRYASSMTNDELSSSLASLEDIWTSSNPSNKNFSYNPEGANIAFVRGLIETAHRRLKLDLSNEKIAVIPNPHFYDREKIEYLQEKGYKFTSSEIGGNLGIKEAEEIFDDFHRVRSIKPTKVETKKLKLLREAINLFKENDAYHVLPDMDDAKEYVYDAKNSPNKNVQIKASIEGSKYNGLLIDRDYLSSHDFYYVLSQAISEILHIHGSTSSSNYSYGLTDMLRSELKTFINDPSVGQKLAAIKEMYDLAK